MLEKCRVNRVKGNHAYIELVRNPKCDGCKACAFYGQDKIVLPAIKGCECEAGDTVVVEMPEKQYILAPLLLFGFPLICFLIGLLIGTAVGGELIMVLFGFAFAALGYSVAVLVDKTIKNNPKFMPIVVERIYFDVKIQNEENIQ